MLELPDEGFIFFLLTLLTKKKIKIKAYIQVEEEIVYTFFHPIFSGSV